MSSPFSIPPDAQARMSMLSKLHNGNQNSCEARLWSVLDVEETDADRKLSVDHASANELPAESYGDSAKTSR